MRLMKKYHQLRLPEIFLFKKICEDYLKENVFDCVVKFSILMKGRYHEAALWQDSELEG